MMNDDDDDDDGGGDDKNSLIYSFPKKFPMVLHRQIPLFIFWKAKTCQLPFWFWS